MTRKAIILTTLVISNVFAAENGDSLTSSQQLEIAQLDLSHRFNIELDNIELDNMRSITWQSGAVGCPKPGFAYTQALVPGVFMKLSANNKVYRYHAKLNGAPFYCADKFAQQPGLSDRDL
ncbi:MAG: hypothetical protein KTR16_07800 [Acidiferrobacterales bacterium]|nr:hypothetical protein [Acidiferrobacterales bacterium]